MRSIIPLIAITVLNIAVITALIMWQNAGAENYAQTIYPIIANISTFFTGWFRFSLSDLFVMLSIIGIIALPFTPGIKAWLKLWYLAIFLSSVYIWFYASWGMNYYRDNIYKRTSRSVVKFDADQLETLTISFIDTLNSLYPKVDTSRDYRIDVIESLNQIAPEFKLTSVSERSSKRMISDKLTEKVGVSGYINPFFGEFHVRGSLVAASKPYVFAHEASHKASVSSEDEANFIAFITCNRSGNDFARFSGYYSVIPYMLSSLYALTPKEEFERVRDMINPQILDLYRYESQYYGELYSETLGNIQSKLYEHYLTRNNVSSGVKSYSEVVGLLLNFQDMI